MSRVASDVRAVHCPPGLCYGIQIRGRIYRKIMFTLLMLVFVPFNSRIGLSGMLHGYGGDVDDGDDDDDDCGAGLNNLLLSLSSSL